MNKYFFFSLFAVAANNAMSTTPNLHGQSGYINMPSASVEEDGTFSMGYSYDAPYGDLWLSSTILPFIQVTGRYVSITGIQGFSSTTGYGTNYGRYKDKVLDAKIRLWNEGTWLPSVAVGRTDLFGTGLFKGQYIVASKTFGDTRNIEASLGYGKTRPSGLFGGLRWTPTNLPNWSLVAEYDANDYANDFSASQTFAGQRKKGPAAGLEYRWGWLGIQAARHQNNSSINAFVSIPFSEKEFVPKIYEPAYYQEQQVRQRPSIAEWQRDPAQGTALVQALISQDYKNVRIELKDNTLHLTLTNNRISNLGRAVGRAARTALAFAPIGTTSLRITYTRTEQPFATYTFSNLEKLNAYLDGKILREDFLDTVQVNYATPGDIIHTDQEGMLAGVKDDSGLGLLLGQEGHIIQISSVDQEANRFKIIPKLGFFFNDPSGALHYELAAVTHYDKRLSEGLYLNSTLGLKIVETVSEVKQPSNSLLPHVRSDVADYKRGNALKLHRLLLNKYFTPDERWYARVSGGIYEEMFRGIGSQVLYLPKDSRWATDLSVDALQQRDFKGWLGKQNYNTVTAIGALHYRLPYDVTATARVGRFLAKDEGVRGELKRRFHSGIEVGAWYTRTNGHDTTSPGSVASPYFDKGIFVSIPLGTMLPSDSQATAGFALSPWTRDVGQMVVSPGDLYDMLENPRRDLTTGDGLGNFAERSDERPIR
jgi:Exopolysaccharide biosynthesis protein YbjH